MVLRDIETGEIIVKPYVLMRTTEHRQALMNIVEFNERSRAFKEDTRDIYETVTCELVSVDCDGNQQCREISKLPKIFFPNTYQYLTMQN